MTQQWNPGPLVLDNREYSDSYRGEIFRSERYRIAECRDNWQWIIQQRAGIRHGQPRWDNLSFCRSREALLRLWTGLHRHELQEDWSVLYALTRTYGGDS